MSAEALFGEGQERAEFEQLAVEQSQPEETEDGLLFLTITLSLALCPATAALTYAYDC